jgi:hypothetical protein
MRRNDGFSEGKDTQNAQECYTQSVDKMSVDEMRAELASIARDRKDRASVIEFSLGELERVKATADEAHTALRQVWDAHNAQYPAKENESSREMWARHMAEMQSIAPQLKVFHDALKKQMRAQRTLKRLAREDKAFEKAAQAREKELHARLKKQSGDDSV